MRTDEEYMAIAIEQAILAQSIAEVPVGAIIVDSKGEVIASGHNNPITSHDPTCHAEIVVIRQAAKRFGNYRLAPKLTLYVTLEPCTMCAGAIANARIERLVYSATDHKNGAIESGVRFFDTRSAHHKLQVTGGVLASESGQLLKDFFAAKRLS
jgi:tRNA(adenine34) deaminase